jgi:dTDP-4-amino-4,6-dideoxygalactose transaminase
MDESTAFILKEPTAMDAARTGPVLCPNVWPYRLSEAGLTAYLQDAKAVLSAGQFRSLNGWSQRVCELVHEGMRLPESWSVLPLRTGTDGLMLAIKASGVVPGDAVAVPNMAFEAVAGAVLRTGAQPVWLDLDGRQWNLSKTSVASSLDRTRKPKAVIAVDNFGSPCDWQGIGALCREEGLPLVLDSCESLGACHPEGPPSQFADMVVTSFSFSHPIHAAGAGGALCGPTELIEAIRPRPEFGTWPCRLPELNAAYLVHAWPDLAGAVEHLNEIYRRYRAGLEELGAVPQEVLKEARASPIFAPFRLPADWGEGPSELLPWLRRHGIMARRAFPLQSARFNLGPDRPTAARLYEEIVCLPTGSAMPLEWVDRVIEVMAEWKRVASHRVV